MKLREERRFGITPSGELTIPEGVEYIADKEFFMISSIKKIVFPRSMREIGEDAFGGILDLKEVVFLNGGDYLKIHDRAFKGCRNLRNIVFPSASLTIGNQAFRECESLESIYLPVKTIGVGRGAFSYCHNLSVVKIGGHNIQIFAHAFICCERIRKIIFKEKVYFCFPVFTDVGVVLKKEKQENGLSLFKMQKLEEIKNGEIFGSVFFAYEDESFFRGEGDTPEEALKDYFFVKNREYEKDKLILGLRKDSLITAQQYRIISGSCYYGVRAFCDLYKIKEDDKWPMSKIAEKIKAFGTDETIDCFLRFYNEL